MVLMIVRLYLIKFLIWFGFIVFYIYDGINFFKEKNVYFEN